MTAKVSNTIIASKSKEYYEKIMNFAINTGGVLDDNELFDLHQTAKEQSISQVCDHLPIYDQTFYNYLFVYL